MCSAFSVTADTTIKQRQFRKTAFDPYLLLDSVIANWAASELSLNC